MTEITEPAVDFPTRERELGAGFFVPRDVTFVRGEGARLWDADGRRYLDCASAYGVTSLGHAHPAVVRAIREQAGRLMSCTPSYGNDQRAEYMGELTNALPAGLDRVFLCNSGTEAVEGALKIARLTTGRAGVVACMRGFHGRTMGALSATHDRKYRDPFAPLVPGFTHVPYNKLEKLESAVTDETAAVIVEVVQGEGGVRVGEPEFLQRAQSLCREHGAMLVIDEVQTGFGRTGELFATNHHGLEPDLIALAKGIAGGFPMGAVAIGSRVGELPVGAHGSTFGGNPLACAAARATLKALVEERVPARVAENGVWLLERLRAIESPKIREVRGLGLLVGMELKESSQPYLAALLERGIVALAAGPTVLRLLPPLVITREELEEAADAVEAVLA